MKIIVPGKKLEDVKTLKFECVRCGCVFEADIDDILLKQGDPFETWPEDRYYDMVICPCCKDTIPLGMVSPGTAIEKQLQEKRRLLRAKSQ